MDLGAFEKNHQRVCVPLYLFCSLPGSSTLFGSLATQVRRFCLQNSPDVSPRPVPPSHPPPPDCPDGEGLVVWEQRREEEQEGHPDGEWQE